MNEHRDQTGVYQGKAQQEQAKQNAVSAARWAGIAQLEQAKEKTNVGASKPLVKPTSQDENLPSWWKRTINWIDQNQSITSVGVGALIAVATIAVTLAVATVTLPIILTAAAVATVATAVVVASGTVALNNYYNRPPTTNIVSNILWGADTALLLTGGALVIAAGCATPTGMPVCAAVPPVLDAVEQASFQIQFAYETATGNPNAGQTYIELQLEQSDGGVPGNKIFADIADLLTTNGDEVADLINTYGDDAIRYLDNVSDVDLANLNLEQGYVVSQLSQEFDIPIAITGRWADTPAEAEIRRQAVDRMEELKNQGLSEADAVLQAAQEFEINPHQVKISGGGPEVDVFIPKDAWDSLSSEEQEIIRLQLEVFNVENDKRFTIDFYQNITDLKQGWPDPAINTPLGSIIFNPDGTISHQPLGNP